MRQAVKQVRRWLLELDPSGDFERCVQLGGRFTAAQEMPVPTEGVGVERAREDRSLTDVLLADFDAIHSRHASPLPESCPSCSGGPYRASYESRELPCV